MNENNLLRFPVFLQTAFKEHNIDFPAETKFHYSDFKAYRIVYRKNGEDLHISAADFKSMAELQIKPKKRRGVNIKEVVRDPRYYGVSLFRDKVEAKAKFGLPRYPKKIAEGFIIESCGPEYSVSKEKGSHVTWWLYEDAEIEKGKFNVINDE